MKAKILITSIIASFILASCLFAGYFDKAIKGSGVFKIETRKTDNFKGIENHSSAQVFIKHGDKTEVSVEADDNILPLITTEVEDGKLIISNTNKPFWAKKFNVYITMSEIEYISVNGSGNVSFEDAFNGSDLELEIKGSGNLKTAFNGRDIKATVKGSGNLDFEGSVNNKFYITIQGSGNMSAKGKCENLELTVKGSGSLNASNLAVKDANVTIQGSGVAHVNVEHKISGLIQGSGSIYYKEGSPIMNITRQGSGNIIKE